MRKNDLIKKLEEIPGNPIVVLMDVRINEFFASSEGTSEGIENAFEVGTFKPQNVDTGEEMDTVISIEYESVKEEHICNILDLQGLDYIYHERHRQIEKEGWTPEHDDEHSEQQIAVAGALYAMPSMNIEYSEESFFGSESDFKTPVLWPWSGEWYKPAKDASIPERIRELAKAGALIAAEIDRLVRKRGRGDE